MRARLRPFLLLAPALAALTLCACDNSGRFTHAEPHEADSAGSATVKASDQNAFTLPSANLSAERRVDFSAGNNFFKSPWVIAPSTTTARDGLGPLFATNACQNCHIRDGRGHPPGPDDSNAVSMMVRLSVPDEPAYAKEIERLGVLPEPVYGLQLQDMAIPGVAPEGKVRVDYTPVTVAFNDGSTVELRKPTLRITDLGYGPMRADTRFSARIAPPMIGLGLLEAIPEIDILANAGPRDDRTGTIAGRPNWVWDDVQQKTVLGRFGWKAGQPTLNQQNVHAFAIDMGLTSNLLKHDDCTASQAACLAAPNDNGPDSEQEVSDNILKLVQFYTRNLGVPARRDVDNKDVLAGKNLFYRANCQACHVPEFTTRADAAEPELASQVIHPYTDLLLHNMGDGLADNRTEFQASGTDWRTPPLWGIGLTQQVSGRTEFLHDGRARNLMEAVLWHDGEALGAKREVLSFNPEQRAQLLAFLNSL